MMYSICNGTFCERIQCGSVPVIESNLFGKSAVHGLHRRKCPDG